MLKRLLKYSVLDETIGKLKVIEKTSSLTFKYPCDNSIVCTPYKLVLNPGVYKFECWGSIGQQWGGVSKPGKGAYTRGTIFIPKTREMYVYVGANGLFNSMKEATKIKGILGGGATDVRLEKSSNWWDLQSLKSRIMVAAGGGGAEWKNSIGGNGGELTGNYSISAKYNTNEAPIFDEKCEGATQTSGTSCPNLGMYESRTGSFGSAGVLDSNSPDWGGSGGGGYYGGSSYNYSFAGSGGSSFISGHKGCNAVNESEGIQHANSPNHYSGFVFTETEMIGGNKTMPLPFSSSQGIWESQEGGAFRITLISLYNFSCYFKKHTSVSTYLICFLLVYSV